MIGIILSQIGVGLLGMLIYNVFKFQKMISALHLKTKMFWWSIWDSSKYKFIWVLLMLILISVIITVIPETSESIKSLTGLDIGEELVSFFTLGLGLSSVVDTEKN